MRVLVCFVCVAALCDWQAVADDVRSKIGAVVFEDSFERSELGPNWKVPIKQFSIRDGKLIGQEQPELGHGAVCRAELSFDHAIFEFRFRLSDGKSFNFVINDKNCKAVHAGHICRVSFGLKQIRIADDKEGAMKNEIRALLQDPQHKGQRDKILEGRQRSLAVRLEPDRWHLATISIIDDEITVVIDDKIVGSLKSSGIAHPTKTDFGFTVIGNEIQFDDVRAYNVHDARKTEL